MDENIVASICVTLVAINAIWAYVIWQTIINGKKTKRVNAATAEVLADRIFDLSRKVDALREEVEVAKVKWNAWTWVQTAPSDETVEPSETKQTKKDA